MAIPAAGYTGQRRAPPRQGKSGFGIAVALVLADSLFGVARDSFPQIPDFPRESPPIRQDRSRGTPSGAQQRENVDDTWTAQPSANGCSFACTPDADSSVRKGLCGETPSVIHNDRDWLDFYRAAAMEFDRNKLPASIDVAEKATQQRLRGLPIAHSKEHLKLRDALNSLAVLKRML